MPAAKTDLAQWLARSVRVSAREAHARGATGTKVTFAYIEGIVNQMCRDGMTDADTWTTWTLRKAHRLAVDGLRDTGETHLIDPADAPGVKLTARERIALVAADRGWTGERTPSPYSEKWTYRKGDNWLNVRFAKNGAVTHLTGRDLSATRSLDRKAENVVDYLLGKWS